MSDASSGGEYVEKYVREKFRNRPPSEHLEAIKQEWENILPLLKEADKKHSERWQREYGVPPPNRFDANDFLQYAGRAGGIDFSAARNAEGPLLDSIESFIEGYFQRLRDTRKQAECTAKPPENDGKQGDDSAYVPAATLWHDKFGTYKQFTAWLKRENAVRTRKPSKQRIELHAGDWHYYWQKQDAKAFNADNMAEYLERVEQRKAAIPKKPHRQTRTMGN